MHSMQHVVAVIDWQPLIVAVAAGVPVLISSLATLLLAIAHRQQLARVQRQTNGQSEALRATVDALNVKVAALRAQLEARR